MRSFIAASSLLLASLTMAGIPSHRQDQNRLSAVKAPNMQEKKLAVNLVRAINTGEMAYRDQKGPSFAEWDALSASQEFKKAIGDLSRAIPELKSLNLIAPADIMPGWGLRLVVSQDKKSYVVVVTSKSGHDCSFAVVSDEEGLIREATVIGCPGRNSLSDTR